MFIFGKKDLKFLNKKFFKKILNFQTKNLNFRKNLDFFKKILILNKKLQFLKQKIKITKKPKFQQKIGYFYYS